MNQTHGNSLWNEPETGDGSTRAGRFRRDGNQNWYVDVAGTKQGALLELSGPGNGYTLIDIEHEWMLVDDGNGGYLFQQGGVAAAVLADDGNGGFIVSADVSAKAARFFPDGGAAVVRVVPNSADELELSVFSNDDVLTF
jgi:hypothetical protein